MIQDTITAVCMHHCQASWVHWLV